MEKLCTVKVEMVQRWKPLNVMMMMTDNIGKEKTPTLFPRYGTVSAKIAPRLKCYKNASLLNRYNFPTDNAIDFLFSTLHTTPFHYEVLKLGSR